MCTKRNQKLTKEEPNPQRRNRKHINGTQICTKRNQEHTKEKPNANKGKIENPHI
jgi:hypothetical protein